MSPGRLLALVALVGAALATSALFAARLPRALTVTPTPASRSNDNRPHGPADRERPGRHHRRPRSAPPRPAPGARPRRSQLGPRTLGLSLPSLVALEAAGGALGLATTGVAMGLRRARARRDRLYARYVLHLSPHDE